MSAENSTLVSLTNRNDRTDLVRDVEVRADFGHQRELILVLVRRIELPQVFLFHIQAELRKRCEGLPDRLLVAFRLRRRGEIGRWDR